MTLAASRAALILSRGRFVTLQRGGATVSVLAFFHALRPDEIAGGFQAGDARLETAVLPPPFAPPVKGDRALLDGRTWVALSAAPLHDGAALCGYTLHLRGG